MNIFVDVESYPNFYCHCTNMDGERRVWRLNKKDQAEWRELMADPTVTLIGHNISRYDILLLTVYANHDRLVRSDNGKPLIKGALNAETLHKLTEAVIDSKHDGMIRLISFRQGESLFYHINKATGGMSVTGINPKRIPLLPRMVDTLQLIDAKANAGLKQLAIMMDAPTTRDLPYEPGTKLTPAQKTEVEEYCHIDVDQTILLYSKLDGELAVRQWFKDEGTVKYPFIKGSPKLGEEYLSVKCGNDYKIKGSVLTPQDEIPMRTLMPPDLTFEDPNTMEHYERLLGYTLRFGTKGLDIFAPTSTSVPAKDLILTAGDGCKYKFSCGGVHSQELVMVEECSEDEIIAQVDVASFYPNIVVRHKLCPDHLEGFSEVMRGLIERRAEIKEEMRTATGEEYKTLDTQQTAIKLIANSSYGKLIASFTNLISDRSAGRAIPIIGQWCLMKLVDMVNAELDDTNLWNVNTDAIVVRLKKAQLPQLKKVISEWESMFGFTLGTDFYTRWFQTSISDYVAVGADGKIKAKGKFALGKKLGGSISKSNAARKAVAAYLHNGTPIHETLNGCTVEDFVCICSSRNVHPDTDTRFLWQGNGLAYKKLRVYFGKGETVLACASVKKMMTWCRTPHAPMIDLPENIPDDLDYSRYEQEAYELLGSRWWTIPKWITPNLIKFSVENVGRIYRDDKPTEMGYLKLGLVKSGVIIDGPDLAVGLAMRLDTHYAIRIEDRSKVDPALIALLESVHTLSVAHANVTSVWVVEVGTTIFKKSSKVFREKLGFSIHAGGQIIQTFGVEPKTDVSITFDGSPAPCPELDEYLVKIKASKSRKDKPTKDAPIIPKLETPTLVKNAEFEESITSVVMQVSEIGENIPSEGFAFIEAPTGSGKTTALIAKTREHVEAGVPVVISCSTNKTMLDVATRYRKQYQEFHVEGELFILNRESRRKFDATKNYQVIFVCAKSLQRKTNLSHLFFGLMDWISKFNPHIFIDEADQFLAQLIVEIPMSFQYKIGSDSSLLERHTKCPSNMMKSFQCHKCKTRDHVLLTVDSFVKTEPQQLPSTKRILDQKVGDGRAIDMLNSDFLKGIPRGESYPGAMSPKIHPIRTPLIVDHLAYNRSRAMETTSEDGNLSVKAERGAQDIIRSCNGGILISDAFSQADILDARRDLVGKCGGDISEGDAADFNADAKYPAYPCDTTTFKGFDGAGLAFLAKHARSVTLLSATLLEGHLRLLNAALGEAIPRYRIEIPKYRPIGDVALVNVKLKRGYMEKVHATTLSHTDPTNDLPAFSTQVYRAAETSFEKNGSPTLVVLATRGRMINAFDHLSQVIDRPKIAKFDQGEYRSENHKEDVVLIVSYANSALSRGIDLGECHQLFVDGEIRKPLLDYPDIGKGKNYEELCTDDMSTILTQIIGRIFRTGDGAEEGQPRAVCVFNCEDEVFERLENNMSRQVSGKVTSVRLEKVNRGERLMAALVYPTLAIQQGIETTFGFKGGELDIPQVRVNKKKLRKLLKRPYGKLHAWIRQNISKEEYLEGKLKLKRDDLLDEVERMATEDVTWRECSRKLNLTRKVSALEGLELDEVKKGFLKAKEGGKGSK